MTDPKIAALIARASKAFAGPAISPESSTAIAQEMMAVIEALTANREPQPSDGPDYHAEHAAWSARPANTEIVVDREQYGKLLESHVVAAAKELDAAYTETTVEWGVERVAAWLRERGLHAASVDLLSETAWKEETE